MSLSYSGGGVMPQPRLEWAFESSNVDSITGLAPSFSTAGTYAATSGGTITTVGANRVHSFTTATTTSITFNVPVTVQVLVVGGGGGGGANNTSGLSGGGGGAGEFYTSSSFSVAAGTYTVTVGAAGAASGGAGQSGGDGGDSVFGSISANGGGGGGGGSVSGANGNGRTGGSGGGAGRSSTLARTGGTSVKTAGGLGNAGGDTATTIDFSAAGGGGSAGVGSDGSLSGTTPRPGGAGTTNSIRTGSAVTYAAGGTGGARSGTYTPGAGTTNRGDGGDGAPGGSGVLVNGAAGSAGIVVISYNNVLYPEPTYVTGIYGQAISFNNTLSPAGSDPNCYVTYDVSSFNISSNSTTMSLWLKSGLTYPSTAGTTPFYINLQGDNYNALYTSGTSSNITCRIGSRPINVGTWPGQTNVWDHHCMVFSNVGAGSSNTITYYYLDGSLIGTANNTIQAFTELNLACQTSTANGALCSIDDVRLFNTPLTATQVQSIYTALGVPGRAVMIGAAEYMTPTRMTGTPLFSQISQAARTSAVGAFSLRAVNGTSVKAVQVRNGTTSATQDFYADRLGNLLTAPVTGQPLVDWLGGATGYVTTWYDQSGAGNHASQLTAANQPVIQRATKGPGYMVLVNGVNGTTSFGLNFGAYNLLNNTSYSTCGVVRRTTSGATNNENYYLSGSGGVNAQDQNFHNGYRLTNQFTLAHYSDDMNVTIPSFTAAATEPINYNFSTLGTDKVGRIYSYSGGTLYPNPTSTGTFVGFLNHPVDASLSIGGGYRQFTGEIYEVLVFTKSLYDLDNTGGLITQVYQNQLGYTGA